MTNKNKLIKRVNISLELDVNRYKMLADKRQTTNQGNDDDTKRHRRPSLELLRQRRNMEQRRPPNRMRKQQRLKVVDLGRAKARLAGVQDTEASYGSLLRGRRWGSGK